MDPLEGVRPYAGDARAAEIAGIVAATLAVGNTTAIRASFREFERRVRSDPVSWVAAAGPRSRATPLDGFRHRWIRGEHLQYLARRLNRIYTTHGSLEDVFRSGMSDGGGFPGGLDALARALRGAPGPSGSSPPAGYTRLFPSPLDVSGSPCKRLTLFVRWMVRSQYPDLGVWSKVSTGELRIPLDQHVFWIAYHMGLTQRRTRSWRAVEEVTEALRRIDPIDPVRFDFVLCHTGISGDCPKHRDLRVCGPCSLRPDCRLWRSVGAG